jgi:hypothetical protein
MKFDDIRLMEREKNIFQTEYKRRNIGIDEVADQ